MILIQAMMMYLLGYVVWEFIKYGIRVFKRRRYLLAVGRKYARYERRYVR